MFGDSLWRSLSFNLGEKSHNCDPVPIIISPVGPWYRDVQPRKGKTWRKCLIFAKTTASQGGQFVLLALARTQSLWSKIAAQSQRCSSCKGWVKKCCVWSKSLWVMHQGWLWRLCALWNLDIGLYGVKEVLLRKSFPSSVLNATGPVPVMSQEPQDFPFFLLPLAKIFCLSNNLSVFS